MHSFWNIIVINLFRTEIQYMLKEASYIIEQEKDDSADGIEITFSLGLTPDIFFY